MIRRRILLRAIVCLSLAPSVVLAACGKGSGEKAAESAEKSAEPGSPPPAGTSLTLQLNWTPEPEFGGFYAAAHKGIYRQEGLDVSIVAGGAGVQTWKMVATGKVPFAISESGEILRARLKDADLVALYAVYQTSPQALMVHKQSGVTSLEEIFTSGKIKKVAMESGLPYVKFLEKKYGLEKVQVVQHGGNLTLFLTDPTMAQQCFVFAEPISAAEKGVEVSAFSTAEAGFNPYIAVLITSGKYLAENREVVEKVVRATRAGWKAYLDEPRPTNEYMMAQKSPMTLEAMNQAADLQKSYVVGDDQAIELGHMSQERWRTLAEQLKELGEIDEVPDVSKAFLNVASK
jgi:NitT/TauT family transport system substrate-binding protein